MLAIVLAVVAVVLGVVALLRSDVRAAAGAVIALAAIHLLGAL